ncbi:MAG: ketoacyl-ACP synthase III [Planctomycetota bacterium]|nr:ketoacyl-ACP synthase III [Planctomycetota bacterium]
MKEMIRVGIAGTGSCLPDRVMKNDDFVKMVDTNDEWITQRTGIKERRWVEDGQDCSHLSIEAAKRALDNAGLKPEDLDLIVVGTLTADYLMPSCAVMVQTALGAKNAGAFDVASACTGFLTALQVAESFVASGRAKRVLAIGAETLSRYLDKKDRASVILFGDGAGAAIVTSYEECQQGELLGNILGSDGSGYEFIHIPTGGAKHPHDHPEYDRDNHFIRLKGREVYRFAVSTMASLMKEITKDYDPDDVALVVPHQVNMRIIENAMERVGWGRERVFLNIQHYGNTSAASIPIALDEAHRGGHFVKGKLVVMVAFGAGLTWGASLMRW